MADRKLSASSSITAAAIDEANDVIMVLDASDTTDGAAGTNKKMTFQELTTKYWNAGGNTVLTNNNLITGTGFTLKGVWNSLGTSQTNGYGWWLANTTDAALGAQQYSPTIVQEGNAWETTGSATRSIKFSQQVTTTQGIASENTTGYKGTWSLASSRHGGAYATRFSVDSLGTVVIDGVFGQNSFTYKTGGSTFFAVDASGMVYTASYLSVGSASNTTSFFRVGASAQASGWRKAVEVNFGAHTSITNTAEQINVDFAAVTQTWAGGGTVATQRHVYLRSQTLAGASAQTFTHAYTLYIDAPVQGTNATITNAWALGVVGSSWLAGPVTKITGTASSNILFLDNSASGTGLIGFYSTAVSRGRMLWSSGGLYFDTFNTYGIGQASGTGFVKITDSARASGWLKTFEVTPGAHTSMTAATEFISNDFQGATWTWADGTTATQRFNYFRGFTVNKTTTSATFTNIYTMYVDASTAGTGVTLTNNYALGLAGDFKILDGFNVVFDTTTGTKIGTATAQKLSFWNATPIVQPTTAIAAATFTANTSGIANDTATWDGYTAGQVVKALRNLGILA